MRTFQKWRKFGRLGAASGIALALLAGPQRSARGANEPAAEKTPLISLDKLLRIPDSVKIVVDQRGGATRSEWRGRFVKALLNVTDAKQDLDASLAKLTELAAAGGNWKVSAPGVQAQVDDTTPMNFGLRQQIRRDREGVKRAEKELVGLKVEADLAGVPDEWWAEQ